MGAATSLPPLQAAPPGRLLRLARALEALLDNPGNARIASLVEAGIIFSRRQYRERGGETSCVYHLPALAGCGKWVRPGAFPLADSEKFHFYAHNSRDFAGSEGFRPSDGAGCPPFPPSGRIPGAVMPRPRSGATAGPDYKPPR